MLPYGAILFCLFLIKVLAQVDSGDVNAELLDAYHKRKVKKTTPLWAAKPEYKAEFRTGSVFDWDQPKFKGYNYGPVKGSPPWNYGKPQENELPSGYNSSKETDYRPDSTTESINNQIQTGVTQPPPGGAQQTFVFQRPKPIKPTQPPNNQLKPGYPQSPWGGKPQPGVPSLGPETVAPQTGPRPEYPAEPGSSLQPGYPSRPGSPSLPGIPQTTYPQPESQNPRPVVPEKPTSQFPQPGFPQKPGSQQPQPGYPQQPEPQRPQPGYPQQPQPGYPQQPQPGLPQQPQQGSQRPQPSYPQQPQPGYPQQPQPGLPQQPQPGYPQQGSQIPQPGYPQQPQPGLPQQPQQGSQIPQPGYPQQPQPGLPQQPQPGYPQQPQPGLPQQPQPGYPQQPQPGLPQQPQPGYPQQPQPGLPQQPQQGSQRPQPGYPQQGSQRPQPGYPQQPQPGLPQVPQPGYPQQPQQGSQRPQPGYPQQPQPGLPQQPQPGLPQQPQQGSQRPQPGYPQQPQPGLPQQPQQGSQRPQPGYPQQPIPGYPQRPPNNQIYPGHPFYPQIQPPVEFGQFLPVLNVSASEELRKYCKAPRGQFGTERSCSNFVNCWDDIIVEQECGGGLLFNEDKKYCDYPDNVDCMGRPITKPFTPTYGNCQSSFGTFRSTTNCAEFFVCVHGVANRFLCPGGTAYNSDLGVCDYPYRVDCNGVPLIPTEEIPDELEYQSQYQSYAGEDERIINLETSKNSDENKLSDSVVVEAV